MSAVQNPPIHPWQAVVVAASVTALIGGTILMAGPISDSITSTHEIAPTDPKVVTSEITAYKPDGRSYCASFSWSQTLPEAVTVTNCGENQFFISMDTVKDTALPAGQFTTVFSESDMLDVQTRIKARAGKSASIMAFDPTSG